MKAEKIVIAVVAALLLAMLCYAQPTPKKAEIRPGMTVQWSDENTVIVTTTVSQQITKKQLLNEKLSLLRQITERQNQITQLQLRVTELDLILDSYKDPNSL